MIANAELRRRLLTACSLLIVAACSAAGDGSAINRRDEPRAADGSVTPPPATTIPRMPNSASADVLRQERRYLLPDPLGPLQLEYGVAPVQLAPGEYVTDALGIETTLRLGDWWRLESEEVGSFGLTRPDAPIGGSLPAVIFIRPVGLVPPTRVAEAGFERGEHNIPPDDLGGWLDAVRQLEVLDRGQFVVGGRVGEWFDVDVRDDKGPLLGGCSPGECVSTWWSGGSSAYVARDQESLRFYSFPDRAGPIYVLVGAEDDEFDDWNALTMELLAASEFGPSAPHPVEPGVSAGVLRSHEPGSTWRFTMFPGLSVTPKRFSLSSQRPGLLDFQAIRGAGTARAGIVRPVATFAGDPLDDVDAVVAALGDAGLRRSDEEPSLDYAVAMFDGAVEGPILRRSEVRTGDDPAFVGWPEFLQHEIRVWVLDTPVGPLLLAAVGAVQEQLEFAIPQAEELSRSISFDPATD